MLPERYRTEVRTGRDHDIEEYLAADDVLDRPVLIRQLDPTASANRRHGFLRSVRQAAAISHTHLIDVYAADQDNEIAYAVLEWAGGMTIADRIEAGIAMDRNDFLPNAAGLAEAVDQLHQRGYVHGSIDTTAIYYTTGHPAKLGAFGRQAEGTADAARDVVDLADVLTSAAGDAGSWDDEIGPHVSAILGTARAGTLSAAELADALHTAPGPSPEAAPKDTWTWRWVGPGGVLLALAIAAAVLALITQDNAENPFRLPDPQATTITNPPTTTTTTSVQPPITITEISIYDPLGDDAEFDQRLPSLTDADPETAWRTERYFDPLSSVKGGVGIVIRLSGQPASMTILGSPTTELEMRWTPTAIAPDSPSDWETVAVATLPAEELVVDLPPRSEGLWLIWLTDVAVQDEFHFSLLSEVRFDA